MCNEGCVCVHVMKAPPCVCRKLEQDHRERLAAVRSELLREMAQVQQQAGQQREELEIQMEKIREDETFLRDHLSITVKVTPTWRDATARWVSEYWS